MKPIAFALMLAGTLGFAGAPGSAPAAAMSPASPPPVATVHIRDFAFAPRTLTIHSGETVLFVNDDSDAHTVTADDKSFDSGGLDTNDRWRHAFATAGTYGYFCALHPYMKGTIVVAPRATKGAGA